MEYENNERGYDEEPSYSRDRSRSPRPDRDGDARIRDAGDDRAPAAAPREADEAPNEGSNLFVTGIHPSLAEEDIQRLFEKYGDVESCSIMRDPHTRESRGFGFVKMQLSDQADAAKNGLNGETIQGRTLSIEKARRSRPRTPTPGKYFGPPKRDDRRGGGRFGGGDRYDDRRGGYGRRDDYRDRGYRDRYDDRRYDDRGYGGGYSRRDRDDYGSRGGSYRDDRYGGRGDDRRGGGGYSGGGGGSSSGGGYDRQPREARGGDASYAEGSAPAARSYDDDRYARR
ncbi:RNA-binding domain-containing protein [Myriangium duriaei CBS 260.36]|uniref:RNA-binding domain-containing protein n=1 Tax=Myriangium duriaei CBS 260.36 TaxID=1168546 RepID=A0A9P4J4X2_9PEZI|nr:RNA-binding domain-containing protein [Myriangium duriaei CBS 260.36]